jgi:hypothetical protein
MKKEFTLYGRLKDLGLGSSVVVDLPPRSNCRQALHALEFVFKGGRHSLKGCVLATSKAVLSPSDAVPKQGVLAVLPPVCGG